MILEIALATTWVLTILILARALISWVPNLIDPRGPVGEFLFTVTEPLLSPIRSLMPRMMIDFSPMIAILLLHMLRIVISGQT